MLSKLLLLALVATAFGAPSRKFLPRFQAPGGRVVGGQLAEDGQFPYQCFLDVSIGGSLNHYCSCSIISETDILTAAHCIHDANQPSVTAVVTFGAESHDGRDPDEETRDSIRTLPHPDYGALTLNGDIGLIKVSAITLGTKATAIPLTNTEPAAGIMGTVSGYGKTTDEQVSVSQVLSWVDVPVLGRAACEAVYGATINEHKICSDASDGKGVCSGDSGGPYALADEARRVQLGVNSFVHVDGCESGNPHGYANVAFFSDWLAANTDGATFVNPFPL